MLVWGDEGGEPCDPANDPIVKRAAMESDKHNVRMKWIIIPVLAWRVGWLEVRVLPQLTETSESGYWE